MAAGDASELPDVAEVLAPILGRVPRERQPLLLALAERLAADRYRGWASLAGSEVHSDALLACAAREEDIAGRIEALYPDAAALQGDLLARNPDLTEINRNLFAGRPVDRQMAIQARGERLGAATWRAFARDADDRRAEVFRACAVLEEESAAVLEGILGDSPT
jgi:hypothetical protein